MRKILSFLVLALFMAVTASADYYVGNRLTVSDVQDGDLVILEAASSTVNYGYYIKETTDGYFWKEGLGDNCVWRLISTGDADTYYFQNVSTGNYISGNGYTVADCKTVSDQASAAQIKLNGWNSSWYKYTYYPQGWDENSTIISMVGGGNYGNRLFDDAKTNGTFNRDGLHCDPYNIFKVSTSTGIPFSSMTNTTEAHNGVVVNGLTYDLSTALLTPTGQMNGNLATLTTANQNLTLESLNIPATVTYNGVTYKVTKIENEAFQYGGFSTLTFDNPSNLTTLDDWTFCYCNNVKNVVVPEGIHTLSYARAFSKMNSLETATLPTTIKTLEGWSFGDDPAFTTLIFTSDTPPTSVATSVFDGTSVPGNITIVVPTEDAITSYSAIAAFTNNGTRNVKRIISYATYKQEAYDNLQTLITNDETTFSSTPVTDHLPGYTTTSVTGYQQALTAAKAITLSNTVEEINTAYNTLLDNEPVALEIEDGAYYYALSANTKSSETLALRIKSGDTQLGYGVLDNNSADFVFQATKSTNNSNYWFFQNFGTDLYIGKANAWYNDKIKVSETPADNQLQALVGTDGNGDAQEPAYYWNNVYNDAGSFGLTFVPDRFGWHANTDNGSTEGLIYNFASTTNPANYNYNRWFLVPVPDEVITALDAAKKAAMFETLSNLITSYEAENIIASTNPGFYTEVSVQPYENALNTAKAITATDTYETQKAAYDALRAAHTALEVVEITEGYYYWINCRESYKTANGAYPGLYTDAATGYTKFKPFEKNHPEFIFKLTQSSNGNGWYAQNIADNYYMGGDSRETHAWYGGDLSCTPDATYYQIFILKETGKYWVTDNEFGSPTSGGTSRCVNTTNATGNILRWTQRTDNIEESKYGYNLSSLIRVDVEAITIGATGYSTYVSDKALIIPEGVTAYGITGVEGTEVVMQQLSGNVLAADEPVILQGEAGKKFYFIATDEIGSTISGNTLEGTGTIGKAVAANEAYVLFNNNGTAVFRVAAAMTLPAHKAYLPASVVGSSGAKEFSFGDLTGVKAVEASDAAESKTYYDLSGRKVAAPQKGQLYIVNGKKVLY